MHRIEQIEKVFQSEPSFAVIKTHEQKREDRRSAHRKNHKGQYSERQQKRRILSGKIEQDNEQYSECAVIRIYEFSRPRNPDGKKSREYRFFLKSFNENECNQTEKQGEKDIVMIPIEKLIEESQIERNFGDHGKYSEPERIFLSVLGMP